VRPLSVALLSWEYPPVVVGGLSRHVHQLARGLAEKGHRPTVYSRAHPQASSESLERGVRVVRIQGWPRRLTSRNLVQWVGGFNRALARRALPDFRREAPDVLHAHDWLVAWAAEALRDALALPLVATIHATEFGRHGGRIHGATQRMIDGVERRLTAGADRVIACSEHMRREVRDLFDVEPEKVDMIPNEVDGSVFTDHGDGAGRGWHGPLILFAGRLEYEKGVQTVLEALPSIERQVPGVGLIVAGAGTYRASLEQRARDIGLDGQVRFAGFVEEPDLRSLYRTADLVVVPSLYEPFGLVALEAMASGAPVVAADTGGLREIVEHGATGLRFRPDDPSALADAAVRVLTERDLARRLVAEARRALAVRRSWAGVAARTVETYRRAMAERRRRAHCGK
jgi:glycogen(starch) synthase